MPRRLLTDEVVDQRAEMLALPCVLAKQNGVIVLVGGPFVDRSSVVLLEELVAGGQLTVEQFGTAQRYTPTVGSC